MAEGEASCSSADDASKSATSAIPSDDKDGVSPCMQNIRMDTAAVQSHKEKSGPSNSSQEADRPTCSETAEGDVLQECCAAEGAHQTDSALSEGEVKDAHSCADASAATGEHIHTKQGLNSANSCSGIELSCAVHTSGGLNQAANAQSEEELNVAADEPQDSPSCCSCECCEEMNRTLRCEGNPSVVVDIAGEGEDEQEHEKEGVNPKAVADSCCVQMEEESGSEQEDVCRICHCDAEQETLISPCLCAGSVKFVHHSCLMKWLQRAVMAKCELCLYPLAVQRKRKPLSKWRLPNEKPIPLLWLIAFVIAMTLNVSSLANDGTQRCTSKPCIVFYVLGSLGALLGLAFFYHWSKKSATYMKKWLAWNEEWRLVGPKDLPATLGHPNLAFSTKSLPTSEAPELKPTSGPTELRTPEVKPKSGSTELRAAELKPTSEPIELRAPELEATSVSTELRVPELEATSAPTELRVAEVKPKDGPTEFRAAELEPTSATSELRAAELKPPTTEASDVVLPSSTDERGDFN